MVTVHICILVSDDIVGLHGGRRKRTSSQRWVILLLAKETGPVRS
jgi:hypothetical protein